MQANDAIPICALEKKEKKKDKPEKLKRKIDTQAKGKQCGREKRDEGNFGMTTDTKMKTKENHITHRRASPIAAEMAKRICEGVSSETKQ